MAELELRDVVRDFQVGKQSVRALDGVTFAVREGQFVAVTGPSGSGKSTLLHVLGGLDQPTSGAVLMDGRELGAVTDDELAELRRHRVGFVFQFFNLLPTLSAWENVAVPRLLDGVPLTRVRGDAEALLGRVGLAGRAEHRPAELSGGQLQRVAIARSLVMNPAVILADEPTGNLDSKTGTRILELLAEIAHDDRRAVVMVTHDPAAASWTDRVVELQDGRLIRDEVLDEAGPA
ncbi:ABC transporter ATP-binding protein [Amycolatopsis anabasis]|uniref:ABC transporter ATP-binding protein n=1 Tax=Amycolatopsis anabasis TaxID=1840409 RepID=UPI00131E622F|nr:ABC transporter ATP-binding protein [Amycolatopsis anabasis]